MSEHPEEIGRKPEELLETGQKSSAEILKAHFVSETIEAGVNPIEMRFSEIFSAFTDQPAAYRSFTYLNSAVTGQTGPDEYGTGTDRTAEGIRLAKWNITHALRYARMMELEGVETSYITARCPSEFCLGEDLYDAVKALLTEQGLPPETLCLEFPVSLLKRRKKSEQELIRKSILDMKLLKVRTIVSGIGRAEISPELLYEMPVDAFLLDPAITAMSDSRSKGASVAGLVNFLKSFSAEVIADGVYRDKQVESLGRCECRSFLLSSGYQGKIRHGGLRMTFKEAVEKRKEQPEDN